VSVTQVVHSGDSDREGQLLVDEILDYCGWKGKTLRLRINDMNPDAIRKALASMEDNSEYQGEYKAGQARLYADWLVGLSMTRYVTVSLHDAGYKAPVLSVGRVQTPTLGLVVFRDRDIADFSSFQYYELTALLSLEAGGKLQGRWLPRDADLDNLDEHKRIVNKEFAQSLVVKLNDADGTVTSVTNKLHKVSPSLPFSLPKLQMAASKKYDITNTLVHAQKLYESGYVTYPRTGCEYIPEGHFAEAQKVMNAIRVACPNFDDMLEGADLSRKSVAWDDTKINEHHAIIPTSKVPPENALSSTERKIYELICARYALQFLADYEYEETTVEFQAGGEVFRAEGEAGTVWVSVAEKTTKPPKPYTYHSLLAAMNNIHLHVKDSEIRAKLKEIQGIGTEATQEGVISTLFNRGYLQKKKKQIFPTELGKLLISLLLDGKGSALVYPDMTALWEKRMSEIEGGGASLDEFVSEIATMAREILSGELNIPSDIPGMERRAALEKEIAEAPCPMNCGGNARCLVGKYGAFWKCNCSPDVIFKDTDGVPTVREARVEAKCPMKGCKGKAVRLISKKDSRTFWKCEKCGNFFNDANGQPEIREKTCGRVNKEENV